jgi:hypothetical protein
MAERLKTGESPIEKLEKLLATQRDPARGSVYSTTDKIWECEACGFGMLACHTDTDANTYSCPVCFEVAVTPALHDLLKLARAVYQEHELDRQAGDPCPGCPACAILHTSSLFRSEDSDG